MVYSRLQPGQDEKNQKNQIIRAQVASIGASKAIALKSKFDSAIEDPVDIPGAGSKRTHEVSEEPRSLPDDAVLTTNDWADNKKMPTAAFKTKYGPSTWSNNSERLHQVAKFESDVVVYTQGRFPGKVVAIVGNYQHGRMAISCCDCGMISDINSIQLCLFTIFFKNNDIAIKTLISWL